MTTQKQVSLFLTELRDSGACNMWGAATYVKEAFSELTKKQSQDMTIFWMKNFKRN